MTLNLTIVILGYITQILQIAGFRANLLFGVSYFVCFSIMAFQNNLVYNGVERLIFAAIGIVGYFFWNTHLFKFKLEYLKSKYTLCTLFAIYILSIYATYTYDPHVWLDSVTATLALLGVIMISMRNKYSFVIFFACNALESVMFCKMKMYKVMTMEIFYTLSNIVGYIVWTKRKVHK